MNTTTSPCNCCLQSRSRRLPAVTLTALLLLMSVSGLSAAAEKKSAAKPKWTPLFDGKSLKGWKITKFGGEGEVHVKKGQMILEMGADLSGVTIDQKVPTINYEISLEAMRVDGTDFFCGLTFPVKKGSCSLILGGWGGGVCGLSSIDGMDASENETTTFRTFKNGQWYRVRVRVTEKKIEAWVDKEQIVDQDIKDRKLDVRLEVDLSKPFGVACWQTKAALRNIRVRKLTPQELKTKPSPTK